MGENDLVEHQAKEFLKKIIDNTQGYSQEAKCDLKTIVDIGRTPDEILLTALLYYYGLTVAC